MFYSLLLLLLHLLVMIAPDECVDLLGLDVVHVLHGLPDLLLVGAHVNQEHLSEDSSGGSSKVGSAHTYLYDRGS
jgi:hypothetical protein